MTRAKDALNGFDTHKNHRGSTSCAIFVIALLFSMLFSAVYAAPKASAAGIWESESGIADNGDFTLIAVPDMQYITSNKPENIGKITGWINENRETENIRFVMFLGDMTDDNKKSEWESVKSATDTLSVPFSVIYGNRDMNRDKNTRNVNRFMSAYPLSAFTSYTEYGGAFEDNSLNTYYIFETGGLKYMIMALEFAPRDEVLEWAGDIIASNPDCNVIITTHGYLDKHGDIISDSSDDSFLNYSYIGGVGNNGTGIWDKLIRRHKNIVMLLCGHRGDGDIVRRTDTGDFGNTIQTIMVNGTDIDESTGGNGGMILKLHFKNGSGNVFCEYYSTVTDKYYKSQNQFSIALNVIDSSSTGGQDNPASSDQGRDSGEIISGGESRPEQEDTSSYTRKDGSSGSGSLTVLISAVVVLLLIFAVAAVFAIARNRRRS